MTTLAYITAAGEDLIRAFEMDVAGRLTHQLDLPIGGGPSALATSPDGRFLYCSLRASRELAAFRFEADGSLRLLGKRSLDADSCYVAPDKTGRYLLAAYYGAGKVTVHRLESDGRVGQLVCTLPTAARAHCIETDASNRCAFVPHPLDANCLYQLLFDESTGQLTPNPAASRVVAPEGAGPPPFRFLFGSALCLHLRRGRIRRYRLLLRRRGGQRHTARLPDSLSAAGRFQRR